MASREGKRKRSKARIIFPLLFVGVVLVAVFADKGADLFDFAGELSYDDAASKLSKLVADVDWSEDIVRRRAKLELGQGADLKKSLPDIKQYELVVNPRSSANDVVVEVFVSTEKSGFGTDGWMAEVARDFNAQNERLSGGRVAKVRIRKIASGTGYQYIASRKYLPDAYSPSNHLWIQMAAAHGISMTPVREKTVGNIAGVVMKSAVADELKSKYGNYDVKNLIDAVVQGQMVMGYTNPFASSTGLNFLVTVLATFSDGAQAKMLAPDVVSAFEGFQRGVPFVALTTLQMRQSVVNDGSLDAFVMEYQTFVKTAALQSGYEFVPFGVPHDNPLYAVGDIGEEKLAVLEQFAAFTERSAYKNRAREYGFNPSITHTSPFELPAGDTLVQVQKVWKEKKDAGRPIAALFLCDVSGSMRGGRLSRLKAALIGGSEFIGAGNSIGLTLFSHRVSVVLPIKEFDLNQKSTFHAAVQSMDAEGNTAMYNGVAVALSQLLDFKRNNPDVKPMLFVLTDGQTNEGLDFDGIRRVIQGLKIPVYTIGYEANLEELGRLSGLVEAASLNASEGEIEYKIGSLLNAQM